VNKPSQGLEYNQLHNNASRKGNCQQIKQVLELCKKTNNYFINKNHTNYILITPLCL